MCREFYEGYGDVAEAKNVNHMFQPMVRREAESAELKRLRDLERHCSQIVHEFDNPCTGETGMLTFAHEELEKGLRGGPYERKP